LKEQGNEAAGHPNGDINVSFKQTADSQFRRVKGNDLVYSHQISLVDALRGEPVVFKHFDGRTVSVCIDELISPQTVKLVRGEGMPIHKKFADPHILIRTLDQMEKGDLYIRFDLSFPQHLSQEQKD
jgi:DnaJ family protein B protein 4